ncbi:MAG TPA: lamin tail domain-containing protein [Nocardioides sp.]|nr:lamin tail domain-containing protein [Nocardioides sp.]
MVATAALTISSLGASAFAATVNPTGQTTFQTSTWAPPSSDPSGITFIPGTGPGSGLLVSDAEIEEGALTAPITHTNNLFQTTTAGARTGGGTTVGWSNEPTGVAYVHAPGNPWHGHLFVTDDDQKRVYDIAGAGADGQFGTADDGSRTFFRATVFGNTDPEDVAFDFHRNELWIAGGLSNIVTRVNPGADNNFATVGDNVAKNFTIPQLDPVNPPSPEGMAYDPVRQSIYILDGESRMVFEYARNGAELNRINLEPLDVQSPGGITLDPTVTTANARTFYIADRGLDPNGNPNRKANCGPADPPTCESFNDGVVHVVTVNLPNIGNRPPLADAGEDQLADTNEVVTLAGSGEDGETPPSPQALTYTWTRVSGPGTVTFGTPNAATTTATFNRAGTHTLRLTVRDGQLSDIDDVVVRVFEPTALRTVDLPVRAADDDALESLGGPQDGFTDTDSADNELGNTGAATPTNVMTGLRFNQMPIPRASTIDRAWVQFTADEVGTAPASYVIKGHKTGNAPPFLLGRGTGAFKNISSRTPTSATVAWNNVPAWDLVREEGPDQRTPNIASILQEIIQQPGWARGNAAVLTFVNAPGNSGRRTAEAKDGRVPPTLHVEFRTPAANLAPQVEAGSNIAVTMPGVASLNGTVVDDGKPRAYTVEWTKDSGPGTVTFANPNALVTTASFSAAGTYVLRLTADDGQNTNFDTVTVTVSSAAVKTPSLTASASATEVKAKSKVTITGTLAPADNGRVVRLQERQGSRWVNQASRTVKAGASAKVSFKVTDKKSSINTYRLVTPATALSNQAVSNTISIRFYKAKIAKLNHKKEVVNIKNTGHVRVNLDGWVLRNKKNGKKVELPRFILKPGKVVRIHTGDGHNKARHLYLSGRDMWGKKGKAVLKDSTGHQAAKLRY